jgi:hypothetical protein
VKNIRYGPTHPCPRCGRLICYRSDSQHRRPYALEGDSAMRHVCPTLSHVVLDHFMDEEPLAQPVMTTDLRGVIVLE